MLKGSDTEITGLAGGTVSTNRKGSSLLKVQLTRPRLNSLLVVLFVHLLMECSSIPLPLQVGAQ